jgi:hypothetical protein
MSPELHPWDGELGALFSAEYIHVVTRIYLGYPASFSIVLEVIIDIAGTQFAAGEHSFFRSETNPLDSRLLIAGSDHGTPPCPISKLRAYIKATDVDDRRYYAYPAGAIINLPGRTHVSS